MTSQLIERENDPDSQRSEQLACPECESDVLQGAVYFELICDGCGLVVDEKEIDYGPEWRAYDDRERYRKSRVGAPLSSAIHDRGLTTTIDWRDRDGSGRLVSTSKRKQLSRLRTWQERIRAQDATERNLKLALGEIDRMGSALDIPRPVREAASMLYRRVLDADLVRGRSIEGVATALLYTATRQEDVPRSLEEVSSVARVERKEIARTYRYVASELGLDLAPVDPKQYVPRFCSDLDISEAVRIGAERIIGSTVDEGVLSGNHHSASRRPQSTQPRSNTMKRERRKRLPTSLE
jgi:transcription initiation factor TFIIB